MQFTGAELALIDSACYQLLEALDLSKEKWEQNNSLKNANERDIKTLREIRNKIALSF